MNKIFKIVLICCVYISFQSTYAQIDKYLDLERNRISLSQQTENEIEEFIKKNFNKYKLSKEIDNEIIRHIKQDEEVSDAEIETARAKEKIYELRKLFFKQNPEKKVFYKANPIPTSLSLECVNGDFENGTAGYSFWSDAHPQPDSGSDFFLSCATPTALTATNVVTPSVNNFNSTITLIDDTSAGYQQYDPVLASFGVNVPTLNTNGDSKCIKLNNTNGYGSSDLTTVSRYFPNINQPTIDFNFSLIMDNKPEHEQEIQPYFRVRVLDTNNNVVDEICIIANPDNCLFNRIDVDENRRILYTNWICARLNVQDILNQPGTIEFSVSDCQPSKHFGTVYIDNICGIICATPQLGALSIDPTNINCPDIVGNTPFQVCGTYQPPVNATLNTLTLEIVQNGDIINSISAPSQLTTNTFCFSVLPSLLGSTPIGDFEFNVHATFNVNCPPGTFMYEISDSSANVGPDVTFNNCCVATLTLASPADDLNNLAVLETKTKERSDWIKASNVISVGDNALSNGVVYHAANYVELNPGFEAVYGSQFAAYPEGCTGNFIYKIQNPTTSHHPIEDDKQIIVNLTRIDGSLLIVPNPSSSTIELILENNKFKQFNISTIDGKFVMENKVEKTEKMQMDVSRFASGIYIITVWSEDGNIYTEKLIKN